MIKDLILKNRSYRRFYEEVVVENSTLRDLIELTRFTPSAANRQPLKYILSNKSEKNVKIFETLTWAGYLADWSGPEEEERPSAYIIVLGDTDIGKGYLDVDAGITMQSILLGAVEKDLGGCIFAAIDRKRLSENLDISGRYQILYILALGKPKETVIIDNIQNNDIKYWRDSDSRHHVPKRTVDEIILDS